MVILEVVAVIKEVLVVIEEVLPLGVLIVFSWSLSRSCVSLRSSWWSLRIFLKF